MASNESARFFLVEDYVDIQPWLDWVYSEPARYPVAPPLLVVYDADGDVIARVVPDAFGNYTIPAGTLQDGVMYVMRFERD